MTYNQAHDHIDNLLDKAGTAYFTDTEKNNFLDLAVMEYTKGLINTLESDAQSMEKIGPLITTSGSLSQSNGAVSIPSFLYHILRVYTVNNDYEVNIMGHGEYASAKNDPFHKPDAKNPIGLLALNSSGERILKIIGSTENVYIDYVMYPYLFDRGGQGAIGESFDPTKMLGLYDHNSSEEILNIAVRKMMLSLEDPRYQLQVNELTADKR